MRARLTKKGNWHYIEWTWQSVILQSGLIGLCLVSAMYVIYYKHQTRILYAQLGQLQEKRDELHVEWSQLLLEKGAWASDARVERVAREELHMNLPSPLQTIVILP